MGPPRIRLRRLSSRWMGRAAVLVFAVGVFSLVLTRGIASSARICFEAEKAKKIVEPLKKIHYLLFRWTSELQPSSTPTPNPEPRIPKQTGIGSS